MALCPFATKKLIAPGSSDPRITARAAILHVDAGNALSLFDFFKYRSGGIESHFHITLLGKIEQYRDTDWEADANYKANGFAISIETQGWGNGKWTKRQIRAIKRLLTWLSQTHDIPLHKIKVWDGSGVGYHVLFGAPGPWTPVAKSCPGPERIKQFNRVLVPWMRRGGEPAEAPAVRAVVANMHHDAPGLKARIAALKELNAEVMFLSECGNITDELDAAFPDAKIIGRTGDKVREDVQLLVRKPFEVVDRGVFRISPQIDHEKGFSNARRVAWAKVEWNGDKFLLCSVHFNAVVQDAEGRPRLDLDRVLAYRDGMKKFEAFLNENVEWEPIIGGDVNWKADRPFANLWKWSPDRLFKRQELTVFTNNVDRLAHTPALDQAQTFKKKPEGADHRWLIADLEKAK